MKATLLESAEGTVSNIDWEKVQLLRYGTNLVISTGKHKEDNFEGINIISGVYYNSYIKAYYQPVSPTETITIKFQND